MPLEWWQKTIIYQIYLRSFKDSNNDGFGDIEGLISKLDYFKDLKIQTLLISPFYPSPMKDNGYDISSFVDIDPVYGTMKDFDHLIEEITQRDMNILLDFVPNHTSDQHPWFIKSIQREEPYTDYYVWADSKSECEDHVPLAPNNWLSVFGGSAWTWNEQRKQFYFHQFLAEQPDLNYCNPSVREEMKNALIFWLEKGVDGFRIDAASHLFEDTKLRDEPISKESEAEPDEYDYLDHIYTKGLESNLFLLDEWRQILDEYKEKTGKSKIMIAEVYENLENTMRYYGTFEKKRADFPFNFKLYDIKPTSTGFHLFKVIHEWLTAMPPGKFANWVLSTHDHPRIASRLGKTLASSIQMVSMILPGIPFCYYGDELGMENGLIRHNEIKDSFALRTVPKNSRDPMRTPMQWSDEKNAGFTTCDKPWLPIHPNFKKVNVKVLSSQPYSILQNYKKLIALKQEPAIINGIVEYLLVNEEIFSFLRFLVGTKCYILILNMSSDPVSVDLSDTSPFLPKEALLELTNNPFYFSDVKEHFNECGNNSNTSNDINDKQHIKIPLNDVHLEAKETVILSFVIETIPRS